MTETIREPLPRNWQAAFCKAGEPYPDEPSETIPFEDEGWYVVCGYSEDDPRYDGGEFISLRVMGEYDPEDGSVAERVAAALRGVGEFVATLGRGDAA